KKAASLAPASNDDFLLLRIDTLTDVGRFDEAIALADRRPRSPAAMLAKARAIMASTYTVNSDTTAQIDRELDILAKAREIEPRSVPLLAYSARALIDEGKRKDEALPLIERALEIAPAAVALHSIYWQVIAGDRARI